VSPPAALRSSPKVQAAGLPFKAVIDTGAELSLLQEGIPERLGLHPVGSGLIRGVGAGRATEKRQYLVHLAILSEEELLPVYETELTVFTATLGGREYQALIGRDILRDATFVYLGRSCRFSLRFP